MKYKNMSHLTHPPPPPPYWYLYNLTLFSSGVWGAILPHHLPILIMIDTYMFIFQYVRSTYSESSNDYFDYYFNLYIFVYICIYTFDDFIVFEVEAYILQFIAKNLSDIPNNLGVSSFAFLWE